MFKTHGIAYEKATKNKSELYLAMVPAINSRSIELPDSKPLIDELRRLERRRRRSGKDSIDHPTNFHDDIVNSAAGIFSMTNRPVKSTRKDYLSSELLWHLIRQGDGIFIHGNTAIRRGATQASHERGDRCGRGIRE
jgi:hypothetical protein